MQNRLLKAALLALAASAMNQPAQAQLPMVSGNGVSTGHTHLIVPNVARHREIWKLLGGVERSSGTLRTIMFPGMHILLREGEPTLPSSQTTANHIGFTIQDYALYKAKLQAVGATFIYDDADTGQMIADLPDGVRVEFNSNQFQPEPIAFHHTHLFVPDAEGLRDWYVKVFGALSGSRRNLPSAILPGGQVDFVPVNGDAPAPTPGTAIDHIGFEVADLDAFADKLRGMDIAFDREPSCIDAIKLCIAFISDPVGTSIELTQGLDEIQ